MSITQQQLLQILSNAGQQAGVFVPLLNTAMCRYQIVTLPRIAAFIAQAGHESAHLTQMVENLNYSAQSLRRSWPDRFDAELAAKVAYQPELIANIAYGQRMGNAEPGDGWRYRGRGLIQVTGKDNYRACGEDLGVDLVAFPELLEQPRHAAMSAAWYWFVHGLNPLADKGAFKDIGCIINTGGPGKKPHGEDQRLVLFERALQVLT